MTADLALLDRPASGHTALVLTPRPFARAEEVSLHNAPEGLTIAEMVDLMEAQGALDPALRPYVRVTADHQPVPAHLWPFARPKAGVTLFVHVAPQGSKSILRLALTIGVMAAATFVPGIGALGLTALQGSLLGAGIAIGGGLLVNALVPIKQPSVDSRKRTERYSLAGGSNAAAPHEPIAIVLGRRRVFPRRVANWYTTTIDNVVYLRQLLQPSVGWVERAEACLGETPLENYEGVSARWNTKPTDGLSLLYFQSTPAEDSLGPITVKQSMGWVSRTCPLACDRLSLDTVFLQGLFSTNTKKGNLENRSVAIEVRYGPVGGDPESATAAPVGVGGVISWTRADQDAWRQEFAWNVTRGQYDVHIRRLTADNTETTVQDELSWVCLRSFRNEAPIRDLTDVPWIELELKATDQLNGVPENFNFVATSIVRQATAGGPGGWVATRNPADLTLALTYPPFSDVEMDVDERDFASIASWRALCAEKDWKCDLVEEGEVSIAEMMVRAASCGRARPTTYYGALTVVVDWEKPVVRQMFNARNVKNFRGQVKYPEEVHGLRLRFQNEDKGYADDTITVFAPGYTEATASRYDSMDVTDKTDPDEVEWEGARVMGERIARPETFTFTQDIEYLVAPEGSRCWLAHHVALIGQVSGRVTGQLLDGSGQVIGLRLDEAVIMEAGKDYDLAWRPAVHDPETGLEPFRAALAVDVGEHNVVRFTAPPETPPAVGDLVTMGEHLIEVLDVIVDRITPRAGQQAEIACIPYAPELMHVGDTPITSYRTYASIPPHLPGAYMPDRAVQTLGPLINTALDIGRAGWDLADQAWTDGVLTPSEKRGMIATIKALINARSAIRAEADALDLTVAAGDAERIAYEDASAALDAYLLTLTSPVAWDDPSDKTDIADPEAFRAVLQDAQQAEVNLQTKIATTVRVLTGVTDTDPPAVPTGLVASPAYGSIFLTWTNPPDADLAGIEIWESTSAADIDPVTQIALRIATPAQAPGGAGFYHRSPLAVGLTRYYRLRARDKSGNVSAFTAPASATTGGLQFDDFASGVEPMGRGSVLPTPGTYAGNTFLLTTDGLIYRKVGGVWTAATPAAGITGTLTSSQIADLAAAKITGQIVATQITDGSISTPKLAAASVSTAKLAAGAVTTNELAAGAVTAAKITAGTITATELAANSVTSAKIVAGSISASHIASATITGTQIAAGTISASHLIAGTITADRILVGTLTAAQITGGGLSNFYSADAAPSFYVDGSSQTVVYKAYISGDDDNALVLGSVYFSNYAGFTQQPVVELWRDAASTGSVKLAEASGPILASAGGYVFCWGQDEAPPPNETVVYYVKAKLSGASSLVAVAGKIGPMRWRR